MLCVSACVDTAAAPIRNMSHAMRSAMLENDINDSVPRVSMHGLIDKHYRDHETTATLCKVRNVNCRYDPIEAARDLHTTPFIFLNASSEQGNHNGHTYGTVFS